MFYCDGIDKSEEIDPTKRNKSRECMTDHYWFFNHAFISQYPVCNGCHGFSHSYFNILYAMVVMVSQCCVLI